MADLTVHALERLAEHVILAVTWRTQHLSCRTWLGILEEAGFATAEPTHNGGDLAGELYGRLDQANGPRQVETVDRLLRPVIEVVVRMQAPADSLSGRWDPHITAIR